MAYANAKAASRFLPALRSGDADVLRLAVAQALAGANSAVVYATGAIVAFLTGTGCGVLVGVLAALAVVLGSFWLFCGDVLRRFLRRYLWRLISLCGHGPAQCRAMCRPCGRLAVTIARALSRTFVGEHAGRWRRSDEPRVVLVSKWSRRAPRFRMRLFPSSAQVAILALAQAPAALAESGDGGAQQAGGTFMTSYPPAATAPTRGVTGPPRAAPPRRSVRGPTSLPDAVARGLVSSSEAARLQAIAEGGF